MGDEIEVQVLEVDLERERISLSLKATQQDPWQEFANDHRVGELVYGRVTKLVPFGAFLQVGEGIEGLVHISEMAAHHVDLPEQVVTPGEELWVKIIDLDLQRRRISLSIKQAAEGGVVAAEYQEAFGEHAYDAEGNYIGEYAAVDFTPETEAQAAWADYVIEVGAGEPGQGGPRPPPAAERRPAPPRSRGRAASTTATTPERPPPRRLQQVPGDASGRRTLSEGRTQTAGTAPSHGRDLRSPRLESLFIATFVLFGFRLGVRPIGDNSMITHLRTGSTWSRAGHPPVDPYSFTAPGHGWVVQSWLPEWTYGWAYRLGGFRLVVLEQALLISLLVWLVVRLVRAGSPLRTAFGGHRRRDRIAVLVAPPPAVRRHLHGAHHHHRREPAQPLAPDPGGVAVGEQPRLVPPRTGLARRPGGGRGVRLAGLAPRRHALRGRVRGGTGGGGGESTRGQAALLPVHPG